MNEQAKRIKKAERQFNALNRTLREIIRADGRNLEVTISNSFYLAETDDGKTYDADVLCFPIKGVTWTESGVDGVTPR